jgi:PAS domain S-box-containing protein
MNLAAAATGLGMWEQDVSGPQSWANPQQRDLLGIGAAESCDFDRFIAAVLPDDRVAVNATLERAKSKGGEFEVQYRVERNDGQMRWLASRGTVELDSRGRPTRLRGVTSDVTHRIEAELDAQRHRDELAHLSRIAMLGQLSGSLAHELNQPLTAILSNAQAALRFLKTDPVDLDEVREILVDIVTNDQRAGDIIRRLRALFERGEAKKEPLDCNELVRDVLRLLHSDLVSRNVSVALALDAALPRVDADRVQIQQLLLNLLLNACEAMSETPAGERRLRLSTSQSAASEVVISVSDHGKGIPPDQIEKIFEPFVSTKKLGIGLGLAIARSIVAVHGGRMWAAPTPDGGAIFSFTLRAHATAATHRSGQERAAPAVMGQDR